MKRLMTLFVVVTCVFVAIGCDKKGDGEEQTSQTTALLTVSVAPDTPLEQQIVSGRTLVWFSFFHFDARPGNDVEIQELRFYNATAGSDAAVSFVHLYDDNSLLGTTTLTNRYALFSGLAIFVQGGGRLKLRVACDINNANAVPDISGMAPRFVVENVNWDISATTFGRTLAAGEIIGDDGSSVGYTSNPNPRANAQHIVVSKLDFSLAPGNPVGTMGSPPVSEIEIFRFTATVTGDTNAPAPQEAIVESIIVTIYGDAEADGLVLYSSVDGFVNPIAATTAAHATTKAGGDPSKADDHITAVSFIQFQLSTLGATISFNDSETFMLCGRAYALTSANAPIRSLRPDLYQLGSATQVGVVNYWDNGAQSANIFSRNLSWCSPGLNGLHTPYPMTFTGTSYIQ